jgi:hypothetical protein
LAGVGSIGRVVAAAEDNFRDSVGVGYSSRIMVFVAAESGGRASAVQTGAVSRGLDRHASHPAVKSRTTKKFTRADDAARRWAELEQTTPLCFV